MVQREHVYVHHGQPVGFRRRPVGQLVAAAGPTTRPLAGGHYCWHVLAVQRRPGAPRPRYAVDPSVTAVVGVGLVVVAVAGVVAAIWAIDHNDRHAHLVKTIGNLAGGAAAGLLSTCGLTPPPGRRDTGSSWCRPTSSCSAPCG